jgi:chromosome segregation ATPase
MNRWAVGAIGILAVALVGVTWYGKGRIDDLRLETESQVDALSARLLEVEATRIDVALAQGLQRLQGIEETISDVDQEIDNLTQQVSELDTEIGNEPPPFQGDTIWQRLAELEQRLDETGVSLGLTIADLADVTETANTSSQTVAAINRELDQIATTISNQIAQLETCLSYLLSPNRDFLPAVC